MRKFQILLGALGVVAVATTAHARPRRCATTYAPVAAAPVAVPATAQTATGYRAFSYQPTATATVETVSPTPRAVQAGWMKAASKALGRY